MDVDDWTGPKRDRMFEPRRLPFSPVAKGFVAHVQARLEALEARKRRRKAADQTNFERAVAALVSDLVATALQDEDRWTSVELSKQRLSPANRRAEFMTEQFPETVRLLADDRLGLVELRTAPPGTLHGLQSTMRAMSGLIREIHVAGLAPADFRKIGKKKKKAGPVVELRGNKVPKWKGGRRTEEAPRLELPDSLEVRQLQMQMEELNNWLDSADLDFIAEPDPHKNWDLTDRRMTRIFNGESLHKGGRLYGGFWQGMSGYDRLFYIGWNGEEGTASLDYGQASIRMAYAEVGAVPPQGDLYQVAHWDRQGIKAVMNALLSADGELERFPRGTRQYFPPSTKFHQVYRDIYWHHRPITELFGSGRGLDVMFRESQVLLRVVFRLKGIGIHALPIHDGILVADRYVGEAKATMEEEFFAVTGAPALVTVETVKGNGLIEEVSL